MASKIKRNYLPEISALLFGRSKPSMVTVNLTDRCDQKCIYCEIGENIPSSRKGQLTVDDLKWIINQMAENNIPKISLNGGEPFLFDRLFDVISYASEKNIRCTITTNGMIVHKLNDADFKVLKDSETEINISIDSFRQEIQTHTRGTASALPNALKSLQKLNEKGIPVTVLCAISKYNYQHLSEFFEEAYKNGIKQVLFQPIIYYSNFPDRPVIDAKSRLNVGIDQLDILMEELKKILYFERKHGIKTNVYRIFPWIKFYLTTAETGQGWFFKDVLKKFYCRELYAIIDISYDGGIQPCGLALAKTTIHENREIGLMEQWYKATAGIKDDLENDRFYDFCNGCCHHFSRNMLASIAKHPINNRVALYNVFSLVFMRNLYGIFNRK